MAARAEVEGHQQEEQPSRPRLPAAMASGYIVGVEDAASPDASFSFMEAGHFERQRSDNSEESIRTRGEVYDQLVRRYREDHRARQALFDFLATHGFQGVRHRRQGLLGFRFTYALHEASRLGNVAIVMLLLQAGADQAAVDSKGRTAADVARQQDRRGSHREILAALADGAGLSKARRVPAHPRPDCGGLSVLDSGPGAHWEAFFERLAADPLASKRPRPAMREWWTLPGSGTL